MRKFSGEFIYHTLALAQKLKLLNNFGELIQEAILEEGTEFIYILYIEPSDMELKEIVIEDTPREEIVEAKLFNWTAVSLRQIDAKKPLLPEHVYYNNIYIYNIYIGSNVLIQINDLNLSMYNSEG